MLKRLAPRRSKKNKEENSQDLTKIRCEPISTSTLLQDTEDSELNYCYEQTPVEEFHFNEADDNTSHNQETTRNSRDRRGKNGLTTIENGYSGSSISRNKDESRDSDVNVVVVGKSSLTRNSRSHRGDVSLNPRNSPAVDKNTASGEQQQQHTRRSSSTRHQQQQRPAADTSRDLFCTMENRKSAADDVDFDGSSWVSRENARNEAAVRSSRNGEAAGDEAIQTASTSLPMRPSLEEMFCVSTTPSRSTSGGPTKSTGSGSERVSVLRQTASADSFKKQMRDVINSTNSHLVRKVHRRFTRNKVSGSYADGPIYPRQTPGPPPAHQDPFRLDSMDNSAVDGRTDNVDDGEGLLIEETPVFAFVDNSN